MPPLLYFYLIIVAMENKYVQTKQQEYKFKGNPEVDRMYDPLRWKRLMASE
jgi:hypothetical protein